MKKTFILLLLLLAFVHVNAQNKINLKSHLVNKDWYIEFISYQRTGVGEDFEPNKKANSLIFKSNGAYKLKINDDERQGKYLIENGLLFLYIQNNESLESSMAMDADKCIVFKIKILNQDSFKMSTIPSDVLEGWDYLIKRYAK